jgi:iron complex transport system ATP-binding protein
MVLLHRGRVAAAGTPADVMQGAVLEAVYEWPLVVTRDPAVGAPALVPLRLRPRGAAPS